jgi:peroxiredoxin
MSRGIIGLAIALCVWQGTHKLGVSRACAGSKRPDVVSVGDKAPDFTLKNQHGEEVRLSQLRGKGKAVLAFYVYAFSGGCTNELTVFQENLAKLAASGATVLGVSMDSPHANKVFAETNGITFPLLSDPKGEVAREYGIYDEKHHTARRTTYLIDEKGEVVKVQQDKEALDPTAVVDACTIGAPSSLLETTPPDHGTSPTTKEGTSHMIGIGDVAPDFTLKDQNKQAVTFSQFRGQKKVVLAFYVYAFTGG